MTLRALLIYIALLSPWQAWAGLSFHLAYYQDTLGSRHVSFPNDHLVCCVAIRRYLQSSELKSVYVFHSGDRVAVAIDIAPEAKEKINKIVNANLKSMSSHNLDKHIALGILVDGQPKDSIWSDLPSAMMSPPFAIDTPSTSAVVAWTR